MKPILMKCFLFSLFCLGFNPGLFAQNSDATVIRQIFDEELGKGICYSRLDYLCNKIGGRLSGSPQAASAVEWAYQTLKEEHFDSVWLQEVMVPHWVRGKKEVGYFTIAKTKFPVHICALGNAIATPEKGLEAQVVEVKSFKQLQELGKDKVAGKIVFYNRPMNQLFIRTFDAYGDAASMRSQGAVEASKLGAVGVIVRSLSTSTDNFPHTGAMHYHDSFPKIPACAISTFDADLLSGALKTHPEMLFYFKQNCDMLPDVLSYNVVAQINGYEKPEEIIMVGGHLDAWDNGQGAHDDGAGCVQSMEVLRLFKTAGIVPKRSIRCVLFMNEENGLKGGIKYAELAEKNHEKHLAAIETDAGGFTPRNFNASTDSLHLAKMRSWLPLLQPYGIQEMSEGGGGADISTLKKQGVCLIGFGPDSQRYFDLHHAENDTFDKVNKRELELGAGNIAALVWLMTKYGF